MMNSTLSFSDMEMSVLYLLMFLPLYILVVYRGLSRPSTYEVSEDELREAGSVPSRAQVIFYSGREATVVTKQDGKVQVRYLANGLSNYKWMGVSEFWSSLRFLNGRQVILPNDQS